MIMDDTIAAISTPLGAGGVGIVRVSGPKAEDIARLLFKPARAVGAFDSHRLYHGRICTPDTGDILDEVLISMMKKPHSFTGEDTLEINCHGGLLILQNVLGAVVKAGARLATPGEFTKRAFLNNRIDLSQAEAIADMISAKTDAGLAIALSQMTGRLREKIESYRQALIDILAELEAAIDFSDEETEFLHPARVLAKSDDLIGEFSSILATYDQGRMYRQGAHLVITGKPNVGKSSLLNRLLGEKRAIVTPIPGTTRDFIEESINIHGLPVKLTDTAGIREPENVIEEAGIGMVWEKAASADAVIILLDGSQPLTSEDYEILEGNKNRKSIIVLNKADLSQQLNLQDIHLIQPGKALQALRVSAKTGDGIAGLKERIYRLLLGERDIELRQANIVLANVRHKAAIEQARDHLIRARKNLMDDRSPEFAAFDVREALTSLSDIIGKTTPDDVLDRIFSAFCIGK